MDQVAELVDRFGTADDWDQVETIVELEDHVADARVLDLFLAVVADTEAHDLARVECVKILRLWPPEKVADRVRVGRTIAAVLRDDEDDLVRQYAAGALGPYAEDPAVFETLDAVLAPGAEDDVDVRHNALASVREAGPGERTATLLRTLGDDPELGAAATRTLREWASGAGGR